MGPALIQDVVAVSVSCGVFIVYHVYVQRGKGYVLKC